ncbi:unnamed protein product [Peniophora sp. CBMAI 1063]|nr:unnamed protein product [Peniophora sp. CBMAI 1063]
MYTAAVAAVTEASLANSTPSCQPFRRLLEDLDLYPLLNSILSQENFYEELPDFVVSVLTITFHVIFAAKTEPNILASSHEIVSTLCRGAWSRRSLFANEAPGSQYTEIRHALLSTVIALVIPVIDPFNSRLDIRLTSFMCWLYNPDLDDPLNDASFRTDFSVALLHQALIGDSDVDSVGVEPAVELLNFVEQQVLPNFGAEAYVERLARALRNPTLLNECLHATMSMTCLSMSCRPELSKIIVSSGLIPAMVGAIKRQAEKGHQRSQSHALIEILSLYT